MPGRPAKKRTSQPAAKTADLDDDVPLATAPPAKRSRASRAAAGKAISASAAAHDLFKASELMERIYSYLDLPTLVSCLMLNKANTATCARYLYHTIPAEIVTRMSRTSASYPSSRSEKAQQDRYKHWFDDVAVASAVKMYLAKCPNVIRVEYEFPNKAKEMSWTVDISKVDGQHALRLHTHRHCVLSTEDMFNPDWQPATAPSYPGFASVTEALTLVVDRSADRVSWVYNSWSSTSWARELVEVTSDKRIVGLCSDAHLNGRYRLAQGRDVSGSQYDMWSDCLDANLDTPYEELSSDVLAGFSALRTLRADYRGTKDGVDALRDLSRKCPSLRELVISMNGVKVGKIDNLVLLFPHLRRFRITFPYPQPQVTTLQAAQLMAAITPQLCHCSVDMPNSHNEFEEFNSLVRLCRSHTSDGQALREGRLDAVQAVQFTDDIGSALISDVMRAEYAKVVNSTITEMKAIQADVSHLCQKMNQDFEQWFQTAEKLEKGLHTGGSSGSRVKLVAKQNELAVQYNHFKHAIGEHNREVSSKVRRVRERITK